MPAKASGEIKTRTVQQRQKNGDVYVIERQTRYDPEKKYNVVISSRIVGKIPAGSGTVVPTRPRRAKSAGTADPARGVPAAGAGESSGGADFAEYIGNASGVARALSESADPAAAREILAAARLALAAGCRRLAGAGGRLCPEGAAPAAGEAVRRRFFAARLAAAGDPDLLAYDAGPAAGAEEERRKILALYSADGEQPLAFVPLPRCLRDAAAAEIALRRPPEPGAGRAEIVAAGGRGFKKTAAGFLRAGLDFVVPVKVTAKWVRKELDGRLGELRSGAPACRSDPDVRGLTAETEPAPRKRGKRKKSAAGGGDASRRAIFLHLYFDEALKARRDGAFDRDLLELKNLLEAGVPEESLTEDALETARAYLTVRRSGGGIAAAYNAGAIAAAKKYHGYFALASSRGEDASECLRKYRRREEIATFLAAGERGPGGSPDPEDLMFVRFLALCHYEWLSGRIRGIVRTLAAEPGGTGAGSPAGADAGSELLRWLRETPAPAVLLRFAAGGAGETLSARDRLFLEMLGTRSPRGI